MISPARIRVFRIIGAIAIFVVFGAVIGRIVYKAALKSSVAGIIRKLAKGADSVEIAQVTYAGGGKILVNGLVVQIKHSNDRLVFFTADECTLQLSGGLLASNNSVRRIDFKNSRIFGTRFNDGVWSWEIAFPKTDGTAGEFPSEGIHFQNGTLHLAFTADSEKTEFIFDSIAFSLESKNGVVEPTPIEGKFYGGLARAAFTRKSDDYEFKLRIRDAQLSKLTPEVSGNMNCSLDIVERDSTRVAQGELHMIGAELWKLPVLRSILGVLSITSFASRAFDEGHLRFTVVGDKVEVRQIDLLGFPISLLGEGKMDVYGNNLDLVFIPQIGKKRFDEILPIIGAPIQAMSDVIRGALVPVVVRGTFSEPRASLEPGFALSNELKALFNARNRRPGFPK